MVTVGLCLLDTMAFIDSAVMLSRVYALILDSNNTVVDGSFSEDEPRIGPTREYELLVRQYARHGLCKNFEGQKYFYKAMKSKFCTLRLTFTANHVIDLCRRKDFMLDKWVSELFDFDGDGYITHHERNRYEYG